jgi:malate dehydrogenase
MRQKVPTGTLPLWNVQRSALLACTCKRRLGGETFMAQSPIQVTVTGAAGQIGYSLLFRIASGQLFGPDRPVFLRLLEIEPGMKALEGVAMELDDCAFSTLAGMELTSDLKTGFDGTNWALLVGSVPRKAGMERGDLLAINGSIFGPQGRAINDNAASDVRTVVVGNPCNTNCLIARSNAPDVPDDRWFAMTKLDENRAKSQLAHKAGVPVASVTNLAIWGNHSATQYPDFQNARISGRPVTDVIADQAWLEGEFITTVQKRGAAIIEARGLSSAASAANAVIDSVRTIVAPTAAGDCTSLAVVSRGEYDIPEGLQFGFPVISDGTSWKVAEGFEIDEFAAEKIRVTTDELVSERDEVASLLS